MSERHLRTLDDLERSGFLETAKHFVGNGQVVDDAGLSRLLTDVSQTGENVVVSDLCQQVRHQVNTERYFGADRADY